MHASIHPSMHSSIHPSMHASMHPIIHPCIHLSSGPTRQIVHLKTATCSAHELSTRTSQIVFQRAGLKELNQSTPRLAMVLSGLTKLPRTTPLLADRGTVCQRHVRPSAAALTNPVNASPAQRIASRKGTHIGHRPRSATVAGASSVVDPPSQDAQAPADEREIQDGVYEGDAPPWLNSTVHKRVVWRGLQNYIRHAPMYSMGQH